MTTTQTGGGNGAAPDGGFSITEMVGKRLRGFTEKDDDLTVIVGGLDTDDCSEYRFAHEQSCCECVRIERHVFGIAPDSSPTILSATVWVWADETPEILSGIDASLGDSYTWTRLVVDTDGGSLEVVWLGTSNGYYSEGVSIRDDDGRYVKFEGEA